MVYEKHGREGIMRLYDCPNDMDKLKKVLEELFNMKFEKVDAYIIEFIKQYSLE